MTEVAEKLKAQLAALPPEDREELIEFLEESLRNGSPDEIEAAWEAEVEQRIARIKSGQTVGIPWDQVNEELREKYG